MKRETISAVAALAIFFGVGTYIFEDSRKPVPAPPKKYNNVKIIYPKEQKKETIKWAEFTPDCNMLNKAADIEIQSEGKIKAYEVLAYAIAKNYGNMSKVCLEYMDELKERSENGESTDKICRDIDKYNYFREVYAAAVPFLASVKYEKGSQKLFSPIAKGFSFTHYKDFGDDRTFGFSRPHKGNDLMCSVGTPVCAVEDGYVEALGWNTFGGWRVGIRSFDKKRYYYYAHLKKDRPFRSGLKEGNKVSAGQVIGFTGMTGYSTKENVNNIENPHLHFGMQLIFDEKQKDSVNEIWIDTYSIVEFLNSNRSEVIYDEVKGEYRESNNN